MEDLNKMARLHSAGATVRHTSPFDSLPTYKNDNELSADFIKKWAVPYYLEIASYSDKKWIDSIKEIKSEIAKDTTLLLLGDFNWRTRLVGSYFTAVKDYIDLVDIIGTHLLKSEVCCVGHIYALTLTFFNNERTIHYLNTYLDYYLTKPELYFEQKFVMEALLYLDKVNKTDNFSNHIVKYNSLLLERKKIEGHSAIGIAKMLEELGDIKSAEVYLESITKEAEQRVEKLTTTYFDEQIQILNVLRQYSR
jgi:hypothetical protein